MSVCIAAIGGTKEDGRRILLVTDRKLSSVEFSNEDAATKTALVGIHWAVLFAGNDISPCLPIIKAVELDIEGKENTLAVLRESFERCYQTYVSNLAAAKHLGRWKMSMEEFREKGRKQFWERCF